VSGRLVALFLVLTAAVAGGALWWLQVHAFYEELDPAAVEIRLTPRGGGAPEPIPAEVSRAIDAESSPIRFRACFATPETAEGLAARFTPYPDAVPLNAPGWFECFDAAAIGAALADGRAQAFLGEENLVYGIDRVVAVDGEGRGWAWTQINACGERVFDGDPPPPGCPTPPAD
jgi:hypothetical protein